MMHAAAPKNHYTDVSVRKLEDRYVLGHVKAWIATEEKPYVCSRWELEKFRRTLLDPKMVKGVYISKITFISRFTPRTYQMQQVSERRLAYVELEKSGEYSSVWFILPRPTAGSAARFLTRRDSRLCIFKLLLGQHFPFHLNFCSFHLSHCLRCHHPVCDQGPYSFKTYLIHLFI